MLRKANEEWSHFRSFGRYLWDEGWPDFLNFAQIYLFQYEMKINRAGDLSSRTFELELYSDPGAFLATAINRADSYKKGYRNSLTWDMVT